MTEFKGFHVEQGDAATGMRSSQRMGARMWAPMLGVALVAFVVAMAIGVYRSTLIADVANAQTIAAWGQYGTAAMFTGFTAVFAAIAFAIGRILGVLRAGGGDVQKTLSTDVMSIATPGTARAFMTGMMVATIALIAAVVGHLVVGSQTFTEAISLETAEAWAVRLEGLRRVSITVYLLSIAMGLATIVRVLRFQSARIEWLGQSGTAM